jgi:membrane protease subunit HflK
VRLPLFFVSLAPYKGIMTILSGWFRRLSILTADNKGPWGGPGGSDDDGKATPGNGGGPRNPWAQPPSGTPRGKQTGPSALDEFLKRARTSGGGGGGNGGFGGRPRIPGTPSPAQLWGIGVGIILVLWLAFTAIHSIGPQQRGVVTFLGRYAGTLEPGIRLTLPAPLSSVAKVDVSQISTDTFPEEGSGANLMLTRDQNVVDLDYSVRWIISNPQDFAFQIKDQKSTLRATAESAMRAIVATVSLDQALGGGRAAMEVRAQQLMQSILDRYNSGIRIQGVAIKNAAPPAQVIDDFKAVSAAQQEAQGNINRARGYAQQTLARAQADATSFDVLYAQYRLAPEVTRRRLYYETMEQVLARSDKTIVEAPGVVPYLPLSRNKRLPDPVSPAALAAETPAPETPAAGAAQ